MAGHHTVSHLSHMTARENRLYFLRSNQSPTISTWQYFISSHANHDMWAKTFSNLQVTGCYTSILDMLLQALLCILLFTSCCDFALTSSTSCLQLTSSSSINCHVSFSFLHNCVVLDAQFARDLSNSCHNCSLMSCSVLKKCRYPPIPSSSRQKTTIVV